MTLGTIKNSISKKELEHWLTQVFIPVEPNEVFIHQLKARLLKYRGERVFSIWLVIGIVAMMIMFVLTWLGFLLRIFLLVTSLFLDRRQRAQRNGRLSVAGG
jgi:hypothetical protein